MMLNSGVRVVALALTLCACAGVNIVELDPVDPVDPVDPCVGDASTGDRDQDGICDDADPCVQLDQRVHGDWCDVVFVNGAATGAGDGTSWKDGFKQIELAVDAAVLRGGTDGPHELWVAEGTYRPAAMGDPVLDMPSGLIVRGGFTEDATHLDHRVGEATVLSGDFAGDDVVLDLDTVEAERTAPNQASRTDNSPTVVVMRSDTEISGVEVHDGYATDIRVGIGVTVLDDSVGVRIEDSIFLHNIGAVRNANGGGLGVGSGARVEVVGSTFEGNIAWNGAGVNVSDGGALVARHDRFYANAAMSQGAGVRLVGAEGRVEHCSFIDNHMVGNSGVAFIASGPGGSVVNSLFEANLGTHAIQIAPESRYELLNLTIVDHPDPGGVLRTGQGTIVGNSVFWNNAQDLVDDRSRQPAELHHSCSSHDHRSWEDSNVVLDGRTPQTGNPFSTMEPGRYLAHELAGDGVTSACVDIGYSPDSTRAFPQWQSFTTRADEVRDGADGDPVDAGFHYQVR